MADDKAVLSDVLEVLRCPVCGRDLGLKGGSVRCASGHGFDVSRQGYVNLLPGDVRPGTADSAEMVSARADFLGAGHFAGLADLIASKATSPVPGCVLDVGAGTGYYLRAVLERLERCTGLAMDISKYAVRRAARAHPRIGAVVWDAWRSLPVHTGSIALILDVFAPRNGPEFHRVLRPDGTLIVVTPTVRHLGELVGSYGLLSVDERKEERIHGSLGDRFVLARRETYETTLRLGSADIETLIAMGPSARHIDPAKVRPQHAMSVTVSVQAATYRPG